MRERTGAATILSVTGDPTRFRSAAAFASFAGTAPSRRPRARPSATGATAAAAAAEQGAARGGQDTVRLPGQGRDYYQRRRGEGKPNAEAIREPKRHITTAVYRTLQADAAARAEWRALVSEEDRRS